MIIQVLFADTGENIFLEGVKPHTTVREINELVRDQTGVHPSRQRLFIGGEEMEKHRSLLEYFRTSHDAQVDVVCTLTLRCFLPLLLSTLRCPGPMLAEVEVRPHNDEPVLNLKRRIRDKFRIEIQNQRLHVHPCEMTSFFLRRPLDDVRLLSTYLSPNKGGNFLELVVVDDIDRTSFNFFRKEIYIRFPKRIINATKFNDSSQLRFSQAFLCQSQADSKIEQPEQESQVTVDLPPPPPPQTPESDVGKEALAGVIATPNDLEMVSLCEPVVEPWWVTFPLAIDNIIKRDPKVDDIIKVLIKTFKEKFSLLRELLPNLNSNANTIDFSKLLLKYCDGKLSKGGKQLQDDQYIYQDLLMRREDMLLFVAQQGVTSNLFSIPAIFYGSTHQSERTPTVAPLCPMEPLESYGDQEVRFTTPPEPVMKSWCITPSNVIDCGAEPSITYELTGLSYVRRYGSWDIPEHQKTYVEVIMEGSFTVGDAGYKALLEYDSINGFETLDHNQELLMQRKNSHDHEEYAHKIVYYVHDAMEVIIYGPYDMSSLLKKSYITKPFGTSTKEFVKDRQKLFEINKEIRKGELKNPPMPRPAPFYMRVDERFVQQSTPLSSEEIVPSWENRRNLSKNVIGQWCLSRERVSDVTVGEPCASARVFATQCTRGVAKDGRLFIKVNYGRRFPVRSTIDTIFPRSQHVDTFRNAFNFRIQAQFYKSHLISEKLDLQDTADFKIEARHWITRVEHATHTPDICIQFESPKSCLDSTFKVKLANKEWQNANKFQSVPTKELQKVQK